MNLDSVRELKLALIARVLPQIESTITTRAAFGRAAAPIARAAEPPPSFALGVALHGKRGYRLAVRVQKRAFQDSREIELITKQAKGEVDVRYVGRVSKRATPWYQQRQRPLLIGCSIGHVKVTAGTLGCFVKPRIGKGLFVLSNNHVLANENGGKPGDAIIQQGDLDGGSAPGDVVAKLGDFVRLKKRGANFVDCALGELAAGISTDMTKLRGNGKLRGLGDAFLDEGTEVTKIGRTTGLTHGRVTAFELDNVVVGFDIGDLRFDDQIEIEGADDGPFSDGGDSGSLIVGRDKRGVALLFAGGDQGGANGQGLTYANPLRTVLDALKVDLAPG
ncbi:MAG: hypothetical protein ACKV19_18490 [Verrucomicrobiales bacterium]